MHSELALIIVSQKGNTNIKVKYNDQTIEQVHSAKLLGIHIDSNLTHEEYNSIYITPHGLCICSLEHMP